MNRLAVFCLTVFLCLGCVTTRVDNAVPIKEQNDTETKTSSLPAAIEHPASEVNKTPADEAAQFPLNSPDGQYSVYLEKQFDQNVQRYVRQTVVLENTATGEKKTLIEKRFTPGDATLNFYRDRSELTADNECFAHPVEYDLFGPGRWVTSGLVLVNEFVNSGECAGNGAVLLAFGKDGNPYFSTDLVEKGDFTVPDSTDPNVPPKGWYIANICSTQDRLAIVQQKYLLAMPRREDFSYTEFDPITKTFSNRAFTAEEHLDDSFFAFIQNCNSVTDKTTRAKFFSVE